ncbi:MAG TPA: hypothetical protein VMH81_22355 [Bryobacteraceae bacterium]|nr:hypothetical protein [Bryobacteraceae bacterium]
MAHRKIETEVEQLGKLREAPREEAIAGLRKALADRVNLVVAKAARLIAEMQLRELEPDLLRAFDRLFEKPAERDPQCWAKNAMANALRDLDYRESEPFVRGFRHVQLEASYGKPVDTATTLRGICLLSLPGCADLRREDILRFLVDGLTDEASTVRTEAARGLEQMEGEGGALLLRLKARLGDSEAAVVGQVFDSLLRLEGERGISFVAGFLQSSSEARDEAALALGSSRLEGGVVVLENTWESAKEPEYREVLLRALGLTRQERAREFLLRQVREGRGPDARAALEALAADRGSPELRRQAEAAAVEAGPEIEARFRRLFA